jgi:hypothetical protein
MDPLLTTLKFLSILASGILGIIAALTQTHEQVGPGGGKKLNRWGKWAFALTICGLAGALAQFAETVKRRLEDSESRQRTEQQFHQANQLLAGLQEQARQSGTILRSVEQQGLITK